MAFIEHKFEIGFRDIGQSNTLNNIGLLVFLENIAGIHSSQVGFGVNDIEKTGFTWVLLNWKVKVFKRPIYGDTVLVRTWTRDTTRFYTYRDFEVLDNNGQKIAIATTKWVLMNAKAMSLASITDNMISLYSSETKKVFENEPEINKLVPPNEFISKQDYVVQRKDIDINHHVNNITYLDIAYEVLPNDVYENISFDNFEIMYKKGTKLGETIKCFYSKVGSSHFVVMKTEDETQLHCIVKFNEN